MAQKFRYLQTGFISNYSSLRTSDAMGHPGLCRVVSFMFLLSVLIYAFTFSIYFSAFILKCATYISWLYMTSDTADKCLFDAQIYWWESWCSQALLLKDQVLVPQLEPMLPLKVAQFMNLSGAAKSWANSAQKLQKTDIQQAISGPVFDTFTPWGFCKNVLAWWNFVKGLSP